MIDSSGLCQRRRGGKGTIALCHRLQAQRIKDKHETVIAACPCRSVDFFVPLTVGTIGYIRMKMQGFGFPVIAVDTPLKAIDLNGECLGDKNRCISLKNCAEKFSGLRVMFCVWHIDTDH
jgi:hypothetical protein